MRPIWIDGEGLFVCSGTEACGALATVAEVRVSLSFGVEAAMATEAGIEGSDGEIGPGGAEERLRSACFVRISLYTAKGISGVGCLRTE